MTLTTKMAHIMGELNNIPKTGTNSYFNYKFVTAEAVAEAVRTLLSKEGVAFYANMVGRELITIEKSKTNSKTGETTIERIMRWVIEFQFIFADGESEEYQTCTWMAEADAADDKGINKCATAAEKYFLLKTFIVSTGDEPDADRDGGKAPKIVPKTQPQRPAQPSAAPPRTPPQAPAQPPQGATGANPPPAPPSASTAPTTEAGDDFDEQFPPAGDGAEASAIPPIPLVKGLPQVGDVNMATAWRKSELGGGRNHFDRLVEQLWRDGLIDADTTAEELESAIRQHAADKLVLR